MLALADADVVADDGRSAQKMGVRTDVPFRDLTPKEKEIVFHGPAEKVHLFYQNQKTGAGRRNGLHLL